MRKMKLFFTALAVLITSAAFAQNLTVTGTVTDASTGEPVPFASLQQKDTMNGTNTDVDGQYSITVPQNAVLVFSSIGYNTVEIAVEGKAVVNCELTVDTETLDNAVVVGYGSAKKVSHLVGSVQTVNSETLKNAPSSSALDQLQGQVAGLQVLSYTGVAGEDAVSMTLHGKGSLGASSTPLYVIDGIPSSSRAIMAMNPNDIESISVLKDASATSIYGSRAANGVIYVTTKAGSYNEEASVTIRSQYGVSTLANLTPYENMMSGDELKDFWIRAGLFTPEAIKQTYTDNGYTSNTEWYRYMMNLVTPQYQNDVTVQGGGRKVAYMVSASQFHQEGFTIGNYFDRYTLRSNVQGHPLNWLKFGANLNLSIDANEQNGAWNDDEQVYLDGGVSYMLNPLFPAIDPETGKAYEEYFPGVDMLNQNYSTKQSFAKYNRYGLNGSFFVQLEPVKNLRITSRAGVDGNINLANSHTNPSFTQKYGGTPQASKMSSLRYDATITNTIEYIWDINHNHKMTFLAGQEGVASKTTSFSAGSTRQTDDRVLILQAGDKTTFSVSESNTESKFLSFFGHVDYSAYEKYFLDLVIRNDAVSRFGADVRNAQFWSAGARWNIKRENFMRNARNVNSLDLKVSYGTQGNANIGDYSSLGLISSSGRYENVSGLAVTQPANRRLTWEQQALLSFTVSGRFFNRLDVNIEAYDRRTSSMLMAVPNPYTSGFTSVTQNVGTLQNRGVDITLGLDVLRGRDYYLNVRAIFGYNRDKVLELFDGRQRWEMNSRLLAYVVGKPIMFYSPIYAGVDPEDGQMMWYLPGEDRDVTTMKETTKKFDSTSLNQNTGKSRFAPINGGFTLSGGWKGLSAQADFAYVIGKYMFNNDAYFYNNPNSNKNFNKSKAVTDYWTPDNRDAEYPDWSTGATMQFDTHLLEDASFLRLKNLQVGYTFPTRLLSWTNGAIKTFKLTFTGRNLLTFTKYAGIDPEPNTNLAAGIAGNSKQFLGGIEITF